MKHLAFILVFAGCDKLFGLLPINGQPNEQADASAPAYGDGKLITDSKLITDGHSSQPDGPVDAMPQGSNCAPTGNPGDACACVYDGSGCMTGYECQWLYDNDDHPKQAGKCVPTAGTLAINQVCGINADNCGPGTWCAWNVNSGTTGMGTCRQVCDPRNITYGCMGAMTCEPMPFCVNAGDYPNCTHPNSPVGFCI